jgi:hypothetical protein
MSAGSNLQKKVSALLKRLDASARVVSLRQVTTTGGNTLLGIGGRVTTTDTVCDPQPVVTLLDADIVAHSGGIYQVGDYELMFAGDIPEATLKSRLIVYGDEVLKIVKMDPVAMNGIVAVWKVTARTVKSGI